ncbi:ABC transporter permease [Symmachiella dynata]|mgnify:CR=1 FL=1|uniref:ABC transporter permease n=1 Tax=Symmachiella dynata TaxID=2527995 RepID=UPI001189A3DB|nr:iron export ABC transporter permease subunit FetB [Symmachiella dynata]QDT47039.1 hypothetical protein Pan258_10660 [Symmachiella dynata]
MKATYVELSNYEVAFAAALIIINGLISLSLRLGLERMLFLGALRTIVQLVLVGFVLKWVFAVQQWYIVVAVMLVMTAIAAIAAVRRTGLVYPGVYLDSMLSICASCWIVSAFALLTVMRQVTPWYDPQYAIPLLGMILGNTLNGIALGLNQLGEELSSRRDRVETLLSLGATRWEAGREPVRQAIRTGMIPIINSMMVVGIVSLPGMMTGQLIAGVDPGQAVKYQIVIMFLIASGTAMGTVGVVLLGFRRLFNSRHQFCYSKLQRR